MAQLREDYQQFIDQDAEVIVIGPDDEEALQNYWRKENLPFVGLADPSHSVANLYGQQVNLLKMGRMPSLMVVGKDGKIHYQHYGNSMRDISSNEEILALLHGLDRK